MSAVIPEILPAKINAKAKPFSRLTPLQAKAIFHWIDGKTFAQISVIVRKTPQWVAAVVKNPKSQEYIEESIKDLDSQIKLMQHKAIGVLGNVMSDYEKQADGLKASETVLRLNGRFERDRNDAVSAEDVANSLLAKRRVIQIESEGPTSVTITEEEVQKI